MVVTEWGIFSERTVPVWLVDGGARAMQEAAGAVVMLHQVGQAAAIGSQVGLPVVGLGHREVQDVVRVLGQRIHIPILQVDPHALHAGGLELFARGSIVESGRADHAVVLGQRKGQRARHLSGDSGHDDGAVGQGFSLVGAHGALCTRYAARVHLYVAYLGGELGLGRMGEDHEVVFVVAEDMPSARRAARAKWGGDGRAHVDALTRLDRIDGYTIGLERQGDGNGDVTETEGYNA